MKTLLLNSFSLFAAYPPTSTSYLSTYIKNRNLDVTQLDVNLELWDYMLSPQFLSKRTYNQENIQRSNCPLCKPIGELSFKYLKKYVLRNIRRALDVLKNRNEFYDFQKLNWALSVIYQAQCVIYYDFGTFLTTHMPFWPGIGFEVQSMSAIDSLSEDSNLNPFIEAMEDVIIPKISEINPQVILVDIIFSWDIIAALTLNKLIKKHLPHVHINYAGQGFDEFTFSRIESRLESNPQLMFGFDSVFINRNDEGVIALIENIVEKKNHEIANFAYVDTNDTVKINESKISGIYSGDIEHDYSDLKLDRYFTPELVIVEKMSDKCFWSKCSFCSINAHKGQRVEFDIDKIVSKIKIYKEKYNCENYWFLDEACSSELALRFSNGLKKNGIQITWSIRTRVDNGFTKELLQELYDNGLRELWIGLENTNPEILRLMNKTNIPDEYASLSENVLKDCNEIGIGIHYCLILGFPSETDVHRQNLVEFFENAQRHMTKMPFFVTFNTFGLVYNSPVYNDPEAYGIIEIKNEADRFNMHTIPYKTKWGDEACSPENMKNINDYFNKILEMIVQDKSLVLTWFTICDSPYELLFKKYYSQSKEGNPFQKKSSVFSKWAVGAYLAIGNLPFVSIALKELVQKYVIGIGR